MITKTSLQNQTWPVHFSMFIVAAALLCLPAYGVKVTFIQQVGNYNASFDDGGGAFNQGSTEVGMFANVNATAKQTVRWRNLRTASGSGGSNRDLQVGDVFKITVSATRALGQIGFSLNDGGTQGGSYANRVSGSRLYFNTDAFGSWYVNHNGGNSSYGYNPIQSTFKDYAFTVRVTSDTTADTYLTVDATDYRAYNLTMNGSSGENIDAFSIYLANDWDGDSNENIYWKQETSVENTGVVQLGYFLSSGNFNPGIISDGLAADSTSTVSTNDVFIGGDSGTSVTLDDSNTFTGSATVNANATATASHANAFGTTAGGVTVTSGGRVQLSGGITIGSEALTLNGDGSSASGALQNTSGDNTWSGDISANASTRINSDSGTLSLTGALDFNSGTLYVGGAGTVSLEGSFSNAGTTTGDGALNKNGSGTLTIDSSSSIPGVIRLVDGGITIASGSSFTGGDVYVSASKVLTINEDVTLASLRETGNGNGGTAVIAAGKTLTVNGANKNDFFMNSISGDGGLTFAGTGTSSMRLYNNQSYAGDTIISSGSLHILGNITFDTAKIMVDSGATFDISDRTAALTLGAQTLEGPDATGTGTVNAGGDDGLTLGSTSTLNFPYFTSGTDPLQITGGNLNLNASTTVTVHNDGAALGAGSYTLISAASGGSVAGTVPTAVMVTGNGIQSGTVAELVISSGELVLDVTADPAITLTAEDLTDFGDIYVDADSAEQTYTVTGANLTGNITVTAPSGFAVSETSGSGFGSSLTLTQSGGSVNATVYVIFQPTAASSYSGNITHTSTGATSKDKPVAGEGRARPTDVTWDGGADPDGNMKVDANWTPSTYGEAYPAVGDTTIVNFDGTSGPPNVTNNFNVGSEFAEINFNNGSQAFTVTGNDFILFTQMQNNATSEQIINNNITLGATSLVDAAAGDLSLDGALTLGNYRMQVLGGSDVTLSGDISGSVGGDILKQESGTLTLSGDNSSLNPTASSIYIDQGTVVLTHENAGGASARDIDVGKGVSGSANYSATLYASGGVTIPNPLRANSDDSDVLTIGSDDASNDNSFTGGIFLEKTVNLTAASGRTVTFSTGALTGSGGINKTGAGVVSLPGTSDFTGAVDVQAGTLRVNGTIADASLLTVDGGATLQGEGNVPITGVSGTVDPGDGSTASDIGTLTSEGVDLEPDGTLRLDFGNVGGSTPGTDWDLLDASASSGDIENNVAGGGDFTIELHDTNISGFSDSSSYSWGIVQGASVVVDFSASDFTVDASDWPSHTGSFYVLQNGNNLELHYSPLPTASPSAVSFSGETTTSMTISWTDGDGAQSLVVLSEGSPVAGDPVDGTTYTADTNFTGSGSSLGGGKVVYLGSAGSVGVTNLTAGTQYHVAVYELNGSGGSETYRVSDEAIDNRFTLPAAPANVSATDGTHTDKVTVTWDAVTSATGYTVLQDTDSDPAGATTLVTGHGSTSYDDTTATADVTYYFWVQAENTTGNSENSASDTGYRRALNPDNPDNVTVTGEGSEFVDLSWTKVPIFEFDVLILHDTDSIATDPTDTTAYTVGDTIGVATVVYKGGAEALDHVVTPGTTNYYKIYSMDNDYYSTGVSAQSVNPEYISGEIVDVMAYTNGTSLHGLNGGQGFTNAWGVSNNSFTVHSDTMDSISGYPSAAANSITATNATAFRGVEEVTSGTLYVGFYMRHNNGGTTEFSGLSLFDGATEEVFFGEAFSTDAALTIDSPEATAQDAGTGTLPANTDHLILAKYDFANNGAKILAYSGADELPVLEPDTWDVEMSDSSVTAINRIRISSNVGIQYDGIRLATNWFELVNEYDPVMIVEPSTLNFSANINSDPSPDFQTFVVSNANIGTLEYTNQITYSSGASGWLTVEPISEALTGGNGQITTATVNSATLDFGTYYATNTVDAEPYGTETVVASLSITGFNGTVISDTFDYTALDLLDGKSAGSGWNGNWIRYIDTNPEVFIESGSIANFTDYCNDGGNKAQLNGGDLTNVNTNRFREATRTFPSINSGVMYFATKLNIGTVGLGREAGIRLQDSGSPEISIGKTDASSDNLGVIVQDSGPLLQTSSYTLSAGVDYLIVGRYDFESRDLKIKAYTTSQFNSVDEPATWDIDVQVDAGAISTINQLSLFAQHGLGAGQDPGVVLWDDVRITTTWADLLCGLLLGQTYPEVTNAVFNAGGPVTDGDLASGNLPLAIDMYDQYGIRTDSSTHPFFQPNFDLVNSTTGQDVVTDQVFSSFEYTGADSVTASNDTLASVSQANIPLGDVDLHWSAITSNKAYRTDNPQNDQGSPLTFSVTDDDVAPPSASLLYVGPAYSAGLQGDTEVTDGQLAAGGAIDIAIRWDDVSGLWFTNNYSNIGSPAGNVQPNWDLTNSANQNFGIDEAFVNFIGDSGASSVTSVVYDIVGLDIDDIVIDTSWTITVSGQDSDNDRASSLGASNLQVSVDRSITTNQPLSFTVVDDDAVGPTPPGSDFYDSFTDDGRTEGADPLDADWYSQGGSIDLAVEDDQSNLKSGNALSFANNSGGALVVPLGADRTLVDLGDQLHLSFRLRFTNHVNSATGLRFGLYDDGGTAVAVDDDGNSSNDSGYAVRIATGTSTGSDLVEEAGGTGLILSGADVTSLSSEASLDLDENAVTLAEIVLSKTDGGVQIEAFIDETLVLNFTDTAGTVYTNFNQLAIATDSGTDLLLDDVSMAEPFITVVEGWTNQTTFTVQWNTNNVADQSGVSEYRLTDNATIPTALTDGTSAGLATQATVTISTEGQVTNWMFAVDDDNDRANDAAKGRNVSFVTKYDITPPDQVSGTPDVTEGGDPTSEVEITWTPSSGPGGTDLSSWSTYRVYYSNTGTVTASDAYLTKDDGYASLADYTTGSVTVEDLVPGETYQFAVAGVDEAGNVGPLSAVSPGIVLSGFNVTQGVAQVRSLVTNAVRLAWTATTNASGEVNRAYDVIYVDSLDFADSLSSEWALLDTVTNNVLIDTGQNSGTAPTSLGNTMRFYRGALKDRWMPGLSTRSASKEVYVMKNIILYEGQNWVAFPGVPDRSTVSYVFGTEDLPHNTMNVNATKIAWFGRTGNPSATNEVYLQTSTPNNQWIFTDTSANPNTNADDAVIPLSQGCVVTIPDGTGSHTIQFIGQVTTNTTVQTIPGNEAYSLIGFNQPRRLHPSEMNLIAAGFSGGTHPIFSDRMWKYDRSSQQVPNLIWLDTGDTSDGPDGTWKFTSSGYPKVPDNYFGPDDGIVIKTRQSTSDLSLTNDLLYTLPNKNINP